MNHRFFLIVSVIAVVLVSFCTKKADRAPAPAPAQIPVVAKSKDTVSLIKPPEWTRAPVSRCTQNRRLVDTISAHDPENGIVTYELIAAPQGYKLDQKTGVITFTPRTSGVQDVHIRAVNAQGAAADLQYQLTIAPAAAPAKKLPGKITAALRAPEPAPKADTIVPGKPPTKSLDTPVVAAKIKQAPAADTVRPAAVAPDTAKKIVPQEKKVTAPATVKAGGPYLARVGRPITVEGAVHSPDSKVVEYAWDFNGDGVYEWKSATTSRAQAAFKKSGAYTIKLKATTADGKETVDSAQVTAGNTPPKAHAGGLAIVANPGQKVKLNGIGTDPDSNIVKYEWDFNGDGVYEWASATTGVVSHVFKKYAVAVLRVTDADGAAGTDSVRIVICPDDMRTIPGGKFCIDTYEWPNKRGKMPLVNITNAEAEQACRTAGKRLCTANEWIMACQGKEQNVYPYGPEFEVDKCNTLGNKWSAKKLSESGQFGECVSPYGVHDMSGNAGEWTSSGEGSQRAIMGGSWENGGRGSECSASIAVDKDRKYFYAGFRCCK
ncbi:MAG: PKD domain-containing protein [Chitinivibrionales bacterium]|nr:PKD domain-containing protein [Chitinivibrionales bacterium]